jgi:uncharacterized protein YfaS (alpha-2-macroglobulin family)
MNRVSCVAVMAALVACKGSKSRLDEAGTSPPASAHGSGVANPGAKIDEAPHLPPVTPTKLSPVINVLGADTVVPTAIVIELATPIVDPALVGTVSSKSKLVITPETAGSLTYSGVSELTFTPARPLAFGTTYQVDLQGLETRDGIVSPAKGEGWTYSFKTPAFALLGWAPTSLDVDHHKVTMEVSFSGAVLPNVAKSELAIRVDGHAPAGIAVLPTHDGHFLPLVIDDPGLKLGSKLTLATKGVTSVLRTRSAAATADYIISNAKTVSIKTAQVVEGGSGFYLEVVCDDAAAPAGHRSYYGNDGYYNLSQRCQLDDSSLARIHFTPAVNKPYITPGRAGFRIFGEFKRGAYTVKIDPGATSIDGGVVLAPFSQSFGVAARKPQLAFAASGRYLPRSEWNNLGIKHLNVEAVNLVVREVPPENLVFWMGGELDAADDRTSNVILKKTIQLRSDPDAPATTWLDVGSLLPATSRGVLELRLIGVGVHATSRVLLTNLSLVAKKTSVHDKPFDQTVKVWALGMADAQPLDDVDVSLVRKSGKVVARCSTNGSDGCTLVANADSDPDQSEPFALVARKGDDLTYLRYSDLRADVADSSTSGTPYVTDPVYRGAIYADRGVYRPGDTAHVVAIIRDPKDKAPEAALPVDVKIIDPRTKVVKKLLLRTNPAGVIAFDHELPAFADTGLWRVELAVADKPLAGLRLEVEEFMPERMKVSVTPKQQGALVGDKAQFDVAARYLFGGNAIDSGVELTCSVEPERFSPAENADLTYGVEPKGKAASVGEARGQLDPAGKLTIACPDATAFTQTGKLTASAAVLEAGSGRASVKEATMMLHPERFYIGAKTKATAAQSGERFTVEGMVVDWDGKLAPAAAASIDVDLMHLEADYGYGYDEDSGNSRYDRYLRAVPEGKLQAKVVAGKFSFDVTPGNAMAGYVVRIKAGKARTDLVLGGDYSYEYYGYGDGGDSDQTPRPNRATQLKLDVAKDAEVGKAITVKAKAPYKGRVLWTVETDHVVKAEWKDASSGELAWSFTVNEFTPNVYVSAFLVKDPHLESKDAFLPDRAYGVANLSIKPTQFTEGVKLDVPKEVRSNSPLTVKVAAGSGGYAMVAVVDEGILQLTNYKTPDPVSQLFSKHALGIETYETIGWTMLHQPAGTSSKTGGGDDMDADGIPDSQDRAAADRVQPVKPVALFSGIVPIGADGTVKIPFQVPQYRGQLRVMAITANATKMGRADAEVTVRDPLVVETTFPRFVTQNDELEIPVFLTNMSGGPMTIEVKLDDSMLALPGLTMPKSGVPPIQFQGKDSGTVKLDDGRSETVVFKAKATQPVGGAHLRVVAKATGPKGTFETKDELDVPFLPAGPKDHVIQKLKLDAGTTDLLAKATALKGWVPTSEQTTFWLTNNPYGEAFSHLQYLVHYPYGCIEQTTSSTRPLLYIGSLVEQVDPQLAELQIEDMVASGINRVLAMETPSGGFGYWPGATEPLEWATAYATHMLLDAKKAGYAVPDDRLKEVLNWIEGRVAQYERGEYVGHTWNHYDEQSEAYLHYVLALAGKGHKARIQKLISTMPAGAKGEQAEDLYMLKAALYLAGDRRYEKDLKAVDTSPIAEDRINSWSFYSDRRRRGFMLSTFFDLFGNAPEGEPLAQRVAEGLVGEPSYYYNTQELVWGVTGLGKWAAAQASKGVADAVLTGDGTVISPRKTKKKSNDRTWSLMRASQYKSLTLSVPAAGAGTWLVVNSEGVRPGNDYKVGGDGLSVSRSYKKADGSAASVGDGSLKLGDVLFVEVDIANKSGAAIQNIALVDRLPAGFEIENPRLGRGSRPDWVKDEDQWALDFMNLRDDHLEAFGELAAGQSKKVVYSVRVVTSGKFTIPPVEAEAMYDSKLWARAAGGTAVVSGPWTGKTL